MGELQEFIRVVRHRIVIIGLLTLIGLGAAALWVFRSPAEYSATTRLFISGATATSQYDAQQGGVYAQERVVSYEKLVNSRALAQKTIDALNLDMDAKTLASHVASTSFPDAAVMDVSVTADSPKQARDIANGLASQFIALASGLETPPDSATPVVRLTVVDQAEDGSAAQILPAKLIYIFGGVVGLLAGLIIAFVWENYARRIRDGVDVYRAIGERPAADLPASSTNLMLNSRAEANEATARLRVSIAAADGSIPHTVALAGMPTSRDLARRFTAEAGLNLVDALVADKRKAVLLVLDSSPDIKVRITRYARKTRKKTDRLIPVQWGFGDDSQGNPPLDREAIAERLRQLGTAYEFVIVVLPPLSQFAHAVAVAPAVDGVVAVGIYHQTRYRDLEEHMAEIHRIGATSLGAAFARRRLIPRPSSGTTTEPNVVSVHPPSDLDAGAEVGRKRSGPRSSPGGQRNSENGDSRTQALDLTLR
jgi:receptor protein-tyrosine kinase